MSLRPATAGAGGERVTVARVTSSAGDVGSGGRPWTAGTERHVVEEQEAAGGRPRAPLERGSWAKYDAAEALQGLASRPDSAFSATAKSENTMWSGSDAEDGFASGSTIRGEDIALGGSRPMSAHASALAESSNANSGHSAGVAFALESLRRHSLRTTGGSSDKMMGSSAYIEEDADESDAETAMPAESPIHPMTERSSESSDLPRTRSSSPVKPVPVKVLQDPAAIEVGNHDRPRMRKIIPPLPGCVCLARGGCRHLSTFMYARCWRALSDTWPPLQAEIEAKQQELQRLKRTLVTAKHDKEEQVTVIDPATQLARMMRSEELRAARLQSFQSISTVKALGIDDSISNKQRKRPAKKSGGPSWL